MERMSVAGCKERIREPVELVILLLIGPDVCQSIQVVFEPFPNLRTSERWQRKPILTWRKPQQGLWKPAFIDGLHRDQDYDAVRRRQEPVKQPPQFINRSCLSPDVVQPINYDH